MNVLRALCLAVVGLAVVVGLVPWPGDASDLRAQPRPRPPTPLLHGLVRSGRPAAVRVPGARRVRGARGPWCAPVRPGSSEFVLPVAPLPGDELEVDDGGAVAVSRPLWRTTDAATVTGVLPGAPRDLSDGGRGDGETLELALDRLPTAPTAWSALDRVVGPEEALPEQVRGALAAWRRTSGGAPARLDPARWAPTFDAFRALADEARRGARLPRGVVRLLQVLAALQLALLGWILWRRPGTRGRVTAVALPGLVTLAWLVGSGVLVGGARVHAVALVADGVAVVVLRVEADRTATVELSPPAGARLPQPMLYDSADDTWRQDQVGSRVVVRLERGRSRMLAYLLESEVPRADRRAPPPASLETWLAGLGLHTDDTAFRPPAEWLPAVQGATLVVGPGRPVQAGK